MKISLDPNDEQFLQRLHRSHLVTIREICSEMGVTATAVRQRLARLQGLGLVSREPVRTGRGRPHHAYRLTRAGLRELGDNYADLAIILWQAVRNIEVPEIRAQVLSRVQQAMVDRLGNVVRGETLPERIEQLKTALLDRGFDVEVDDSGPMPILRENSCPYLDLAGSDSRICELEYAVYEQILGTPVTLTQCCLDGHHCCEFEPVEINS